MKTSLPSVKSVLGKNKYTLAVLLEAAAVAAVQLFLLPMPTVVLLPGACCWAASCRIEKALRQYMPPKEENDNAWYYET